MNARTSKTPAPLAAPPNEEKRRRWVRLRMGMLCGLLALGLGLVVSSGFDLMIGDGAAWRELAESQRQRRLHVAPKRGGVYDRNGSALAVSVEVPSVSMDAVELLRGVPSQQVPVVARDAANRIAAVLGIDAAQVERRILAKRRFAWLKRQISAEEADKIRALSEDASDEKRIRGLVVEGEGRRYYPRRELAGPLLGFVAPDGEGKDGLEYALNDDLKGSAEQLKGLRDRSGRLLFSDGIEDDRAFAGHNIYLTIDQGIQYVAEHELQAAARTFEAAGGSVVVVNPYTGEILALASWPFFNPNDYTASQPDQRRDRAMSDVFEPGSTMKMFTVAAGLADHVINPTQKLYCEKGVMQIDNVTIRDTHPSEWLTISQVLAISSNICAAKIGLGMGEAKLYDALRRFGFGQESGLPFPGEAPGTLRPRSRPWVQVETASAAFGQGIGVTNMQMAMAAAALANGGELMEPLLVRKVTTSSGEVVREVAPHVRRRVVSKDVARAVAEMLVAVTEGEGTGTEAAIDGYRVAGKTATAQKSDPKTGRYSIDKYIGSFVGFVPAEKPVVAIAVTLDEPMLEHAGGVVAAPIFRRVAQMSLKLAGLTPRTTDKTDVAVLARTPDPANIAYEALREAQGKKPPVQEVLPSGAVPAGKVRIPNLTGVPARQAVKQMVLLGLTPRLKGSGLIVNQQPPPGSVVDNASEVLLVLEPRILMVPQTPVPAARAAIGFPVSSLLGVLASQAPRLSGDGDVRLTGVHQDSRRVEAGDLFVARSGGKVSGVEFAEAAVARGAAALIVERGVPVPAVAVPMIEVTDARRSLALAAEAVYGNPSQQLSLIGITGTNGKTTTAWLVERALSGAGAKPARLGTVGFAFDGQSVDSALTTPEADDISRYAAHTREHGGTHFVMEVSSIALTLDRVRALHFKVAAFSNLTQDHLDFHGSLSEYGEAKAQLFTELSPEASVLNVDDPFGAKLATRAAGKITRISKRTGADLFPKQITVDAHGIRGVFHTPAGELRLESRLVGEHNLENLLLALGILHASGVDLERAALALGQAPQVPGRLERCDEAGDDLLVLVDYAHTPDALERVLVAMRSLTAGRVLCVFGCGGDRDPQKRPRMGAAVGRLADYAYLTNDNPRSEDPRAIASAVEVGLREMDAKYEVELDRARAIERAISQAGAGDVVLIAGKGHEPYQLIGDQTLPFDDRIEARRALAQRRSRGGVWPA